MDLSVLYRRLELASFSQREQIADEVVLEASPESLGPLVIGLDHPHPRVRLGVIEILRRASYRASLRRLLNHARNFEGDDRVYAMRAIAHLAQPEDTFLAESVIGWLSSGDPFVEAQATRIATILNLTLTRVPDPIVPPREPRTAAGAESLDKVVVKLFSATRGVERIALVEEIERRGPQALAAVAKLTFQKGNADVVAYMCRAVIRHASVLPAGDTLIPLLERTRDRLGDALVAHLAIDDALLALGGLSLSPALLARLTSMSPLQVEAIAKRLAESPASDVALHVPAMLDALAHRPELWSSLGPPLAHAAAHVRDSTRAELRKLTELAIDELRKGRQLPPVTVVCACWVLARVAERGEALPLHLRRALDRLAVAEAARALCALCARLATEEAAVVVIAMLRDPVPDARAAARDALQTWQSPWFTLEGTDEPVLVPRYVDEKDEPLVRRADRLVVATSGEEYILDARGRPVRAGETESGGCL
nr:hypothetical protein [Deltaproteobacteria bacterium]